jgi:hypothetical protein
MVPQRRRGVKLIEKITLSERKYSKVLVSTDFTFVSIDVAFKAISSEERYLIHYTHEKECHCPILTKKASRYVRKGTASLCHRSMGTLNDHP